MQPRVHDPSGLEDSRHAPFSHTDLSVFRSAQKCAAELKEILPKIKNQKPGAIDIADFHSMEQLMGRYG